MEEVKPQNSVSSQHSGPPKSIRSHGQVKDLAVSLQRSSKGDHTTHSSSQQPKKEEGDAAERKQPTQSKKILPQVEKRASQEDPLLAPTEETKSVSSRAQRARTTEQQEYFLCKALHFGLLYLPSDSPLVQHLA